MRPPRTISLTAVAIGAFAVVFAQFTQSDDSEPSRSSSIAQNASRPSPSGTPADENASGDQLLAHAASVMESHRSIGARIRVKGDIFGEPLRGTGTYLEQWEDSSARFEFERMRFRWELTLQGRPEDQGSLFRRVRDSRYVWEYAKIRGEESLTRLDIVEIAEALEEAGQLAAVARINAWPELGGIARLMRDCGRYFEFETPVAATLPGNYPEPVWRMQGHWRIDQLDRLASPAAKAYAEGDYSLMPRQLPTHVQICLGRRNFFPYRVEYHRVEWCDEEKAFRRRCCLAMEFFEVALNTEISEANFRYIPGDLKLIDRTAGFIQQLNLQ